MAKARSYDVIEYRNKITQALLSNENVVKLLGSNMNDAPDDLPYKSVYPHEFVPETTEETDKFLNFELRANIDLRNKTYKDVTIWFFAFCHNRVIRTSRGLWYDRIVCELDNIFGEQNILGIGQTSIISNIPYKPNNTFTGRLITFTVKEFTDGLKNGR